MYDVPNKLYIVRVLHDPNAHAKGGTFTKIGRAWLRYDRITARGGVAVIYETDCNWTELDPDKVYESLDRVPIW